VRREGEKPRILTNPHGSTSAITTIAPNSLTPHCSRRRPLRRSALRTQSLSCCRRLAAEALGPSSCHISILRSTQQTPPPLLRPRGEKEKRSPRFTGRESALRCGERVTLKANSREQKVDRIDRMMGLVRGIGPDLPHLSGLLVLCNEISRSLVCPSHFLCPGEIRAILRCGQTIRRKCTLEGVFLVRT
jgi:hypothetical protein